MSSGRESGARAVSSEGLPYSADFYQTGRSTSGQDALQLLPEGLSAVADGPLQTSFLALNALTGAAEPASASASASAGPESAESKDSQISRLRGTLAHWRAWAAGIAARYSAYNPDIVRPAKRVYIGGLPPDISDNELRLFFNRIMVQTQAVTALGFPVMSCKVFHPEKNFAFIEFRTVEEASNCLALDGVLLNGCHLRIRRPNNYVSNLAALLGPQIPDPTMDLSVLKIVKTVVPDSPSKLFIGGLPCDWSEAQVKELLLPFGPLRAFNLVMDKATGNSKGYAFAELLDQERTDVMIQNLNGHQVGTKFLTVKRALSQVQFAATSGGPPPLQ